MATSCYWLPDISFTLRIVIEASSRKRSMGLTRAPAITGLHFFHLVVGLLLLSLLSWSSSFSFRKKEDLWEDHYYFPFVLSLFYPLEEWWWALGSEHWISFSVIKWFSDLRIPSSFVLSCALYEREEVGTGSKGKRDVRNRQATVSQPTTSHRQLSSCL
jgi:hypothetical protein